LAPTGLNLYDKNTYINVTIGVFIDVGWMS